MLLTGPPGARTLIQPCTLAKEPDQGELFLLRTRKVARNGTTFLATDHFWFFSYGLQALWQVPADFPGPKVNQVLIDLLSHHGCQGRTEALA